MARMDEKPRRRWFRFRLISLFTLVAAVGVLACFWSPFPKPSKSNLVLISVGMTESEVAGLIGNPDTITTDDGRLIHRYLVRGYGEEWMIVYADGKVIDCLCHVRTGFAE
jgi:hypothetical protein